MADARRSRGSAIVICGSAGIGKSRLLGDLISAASAHGFRVAQTEISPFGGHPRAPLAAIATAIGSATEDEDISALRNGDAAALDAMFTSFVARCARRRISLIVVDDAHAAPTETLNALGMLARAVSDLPLVLALAAGSEDRAERDGLARALEAIEREPAGLALELGPITDDALRSAVLDAVRARRPIARLTLERIIARAGGNPSFVEQLLRTAFDGEHADDPAVPASLVEAVLERFHALPQSVRSMLRTAAAIGSTVELPVLRSVAGLSDPALASAIAQSLDRRFIDETDDGFAFRHPVVRECIHTTLLKTEMRALHKAIAAALESRDAEPDRIFEHLWYAGSPRASDVAERAGDALSERGALVATAHAYDRALGSAIQHGFPIVARARLMSKLAAALEGLGDIDRAYVLRRNAFDAYEAERDGANAAEAAAALARLAHNRGDACGFAAAARNVASQHALHEDSHGVPHAVDVALLAGLQGQSELGAALLDRASMSATGDGARYRILRARGAIDAVRGCARWRESLDEALAGLHHDRSSEFETLAAAAAIAIARDELVWAENLATEVRRIAAGSGIPRDLAAAAKISTDVALARGDLFAARTHVESALDVYGERALHANQPAAHALLIATLAEDHVLLRRVDLPLLRAAAGECRGAFSGPVAMALSERYEYRRERHAQRELLDEIVTTLDDAYGAWFALARAGRYASVELQERAHALLSASADRLQTRGAHGFLALFRAYVAERNNRRRAATTAAKEAERAFGDAGLRLAQARAREVADDLTGARDLYTVCGDRLDAARVQGLLDGHLPEHRRITDRERQIAQALANGSTAEAVARELFLSRRTVEAHLASVYRKLDLRTRKDLRNLLASDPAALD